MTRSHPQSRRLRLARRRGPRSRRLLRRSSARSFERYGFAIIADHGIPADLIARAEEKAKAFFALPEEVKRAYHRRAAAARAATRRSASRPPRARPITTSRNSGTSAASCRRATTIADSMAPNVWPEEVAVVPRHLPRAVRRLRHGRPQDPRGDRPLSRPRAGLFRRHGQGRQFDPAPAPLSADPRRRPQRPRRRARGHQHHHPAARRRGGGAATARPRRRLAAGRRRKPGELAVNIGDMLQRLTNNVLQSTTHRVVNPPPERRGISRYSMPFFLHFRPDFLIETLPDCISAERPNLYPEPITARRLSPGAAARDQAGLTRRPPPVSGDPSWHERQRGGAAGRQRRREVDRPGRRTWRYHRTRKGEDRTYDAAPIAPTTAHMAALRIRRDRQPAQQHRRQRHQPTAHSRG